MQGTLPKSAIVLLVILSALLLAVWQAPPTHAFQGLSAYLPLHTFMETFAVVVAVMIFGIGWNAYSAEQPGIIAPLSCVFLAVGLLDFAHLLSYPGMPNFVTSGSPHKSIHFWLAARLASTLVLVGIAWNTCHSINTPRTRLLLLASSLAYAGIFCGLVLFHPDILPAVFVPGQGLTPFKIGVEYLFVLLLLTAAVGLWRNMHTTPPYDAPTLFVAVCIMMLSELCFMLYSNVTDIFNLLGHVYKVLAYLFLYQAVFVSSVRAPYQRLHQSQMALSEEKERAQVTLTSIGDAVITTDLAGNVDSLNPVAQHLTGWQSFEAKGQPLEVVFQIINEETRQPVQNPARRAINEGVVVGLANHTVLISRSGKEYVVEDSAAPIRDSGGQILGCVLVFHDVTERHQLQGRIAWQAGHDALTGLPNRALLADRLAQAIAHAQRQNLLLAVCFLDLDGFKPINDLHGHEMGDQLLIEVAHRLLHEVRADDTVARLGGDEFVLLLSGMRDMDELEPSLQRVLQVISEPYQVEGLELPLSASMGVTVYPFDSADADTLLRHTDQAMYQAKLTGRNRFSLFDAEQDRQTHNRRLELERIRLALYDAEFRLYYQPKVNMRTGKVIGAEALIRWQHPERGLVPPLEFLPQAEQSDLIVAIGNWVIQEALRQMTAWAKDGLILPVSVNIAARQLQRSDFISGLKAHLAAFPDVNPNWLELEVLESAALDDMSRVSTIIEDCRELGVTFALDDFGTGYSSLSYLKRLPADTLKIDQSFVRDILDDQDDLALVEGVVSLANVFRRQAVAEGVETAEHGVLLMRLGCDLAQGYGIARPMPAADVASWMQQFKPDPQWALWADTRWELTDFPLLVAQYDHLKWIKNVLLAVEGATLQLSENELTDHQQCRFGHWYYTLGKMRYGMLPEFIAIEPIHLEVHQLGPKIIRLRNTNNLEEARALCPNLLMLKDRILAQLAALQRAVVKSL